jgi:hypothetical protein
MNRSDLKTRVAGLIPWGKTFLDMGFPTADLHFHYFCETPLLARPDVSRELDRLVASLASAEIVVSLGYERDGSFDEAVSEMTTWSAEDGRPFTGVAATRYREWRPRGGWDGLLVATTSNCDWLLVEDPAEPIAVLATRQPLSSLKPDPDLVFDATRLLGLIDSPALGFTDDAKRRLRETYAEEC